MREIALAARLQHPHIVPLLSAGEAGGLPYFTMPLGKYRAVFDVAAIDKGHGVWRATVWQKQYADVLKAAPAT